MFSFFYFWTLPKFKLSFTSLTLSSVAKRHFSAWLSLVFQHSRFLKAVRYNGGITIYNNNKTIPLYPYLPNNLSVTFRLISYTFYCVLLYVLSIHSALNTHPSFYFCWLINLLTILFFVWWLSYVPCEYHNYVPEHMTRCRMFLSL